tara:strand:+ start:27 stop:545 length:519 start_codon:yes stop_codon:yes gene_type:complete
MGKRGPIAKAPTQLHGRSKSSLKLLEGENFDPGEPPFEHQRQEWDEYWASPAGAAARPEDKPAVVRLFKLRANFEACLNFAAEEPQVVGSTGQVRPNPFFDTALKIEAALVRLENELGVTPKARAALGLTAASAQLTVAQINDRLSAAVKPKAVDVWTVGGTENVEGLAEEA